LDSEKPHIREFPTPIKYALQNIATIMGENRASPAKPVPKLWVTLQLPAGRTTNWKLRSKLAWRGGDVTGIPDAMIEADDKSEGTHRCLAVKPLTTKSS
jgi:hypothetical protein